MNVNVTEAGAGDQGIGKVVEAVSEVCESKRGSKMSLSKMVKWEAVLKGCVMAKSERVPKRSCNIGFRTTLECCYTNASIT